MCSSSCQTIPNEEIDILLSGLRIRSLPADEFEELLKRGDLQSRERLVWRKPNSWFVNATLPMAGIGKRKTKQAEILG